MRKPTDRPNIILVNCDDLGYGDLGCYGSQMCRTPNLDRMAAEGTRFTSFYQGAPLCSPSRGAMLTGCYPRRIGFGTIEGKGVLFPGQAVGLDPTERTFATVLKESGYATQMIGKWHCGDQPEFLPTRHGFDHYYGLPFSNDMGRQGAKAVYPPLPLLADEEVIEEQPDQVSITARYLEQAKRFVRSHRSDPFLLYFAQMYVHLPIYPPERFVREASGWMGSVPKSGLEDPGRPSTLRPVPETPGAAPLRIRYAAAVSCIDWVMGALMREVHDLGLERNTIVLFTSDNGSRCDVGRSNGPLRGIKSETWEGGMRLPFIVWWPGRVPSGKVSDELVSGMDILPALARFAGADSPDDPIIDGVDVSDLLLGRADHSPRETFFYYYGDKLNAVRNGRYKLFVAHDSIYEKGGEICELYDLANDPGETRDVAKANPDIVKRLNAEIERCRVDLGDARTGATGENVRPIGRVADPKTLTEFDPTQPYYISMYDLNEAG